MDSTASVLVICNERIKNKFLENLSIVRNLNLIFAHNSSDAIEHLQSMKLDVVVTESDITPINGFSLASLIRSGIFTSNSEVKIVALINKVSNQIAESTARTFKINKVISYADLEFIVEHIQSVLLNQEILTKQKVLIVDDTEHARELYKRHLKSKYDVFLASDGYEALTLIKSQDFDIILLDHMMPGMSGLDLLKVIKKESIKTNVIAVTASTDIDVARNFLELGAIDFLIKPVEYDKLTDAVERALKNREMQSLIPHHLSDDKALKGFNDLVEGISSVVFKLNENLRADYISNYWFESTGYRIDEFLGERIEDVFYSDEERDLFTRACNNIMDRQLDSYSTTLEYKNKDNILKLGLIVINPFYENGERAGIVGLFVTDDEAMERLLVLEKLATHDYGTGVLNTYSFNMQLNKLLDTKGNDKHSLLIIHISGIEDYLYNNGYVETESLMNHVGQWLIEACVSTNIPYRIFGALFAVIVKYGDEREASGRLAEINQELNQMLQKEKFGLSATMSYTELSRDCLDIAISKLKKAL